MKSDPPINSTRSPVSESGRTRSALQAGQQIDLFGPDRVPALRSQSPENAAVKKMIAICGLRGSGSFASAALRSSLANRLVRNSERTGSDLYRMTWRAKVTPSRLPICQLAASVPRRNDNDCSLSPWATPTATELGNTIENYQAMKANMTTGSRTAITDITMQAYTTRSAKVAWPTPTTSDPKGSRRATAKKEHWTSNDGVTLTDAAIFATRGPRSDGSNAPTEKRGRLNPDFTRWLMGIPDVWEDFAPTETQLCPNSPPCSSDPQSKQ